MALATRSASIPATPTRRRSARSGSQRVHPRLARPRSRGRRAVHRARRQPATLVLLGDDYDGGHKAWVRWPDGRDDIVPGSQVQRGSSRPRRSRTSQALVPTIGRGGRQDPHLARAPHGEGRPARRRPGRQAAGHARGEPDALAGGPRPALERRHVEAAEQIVAALGTMKGAAMKLGQVMSFLDVGLVPEEYREEFQAKLAKLRDAAPKVSFEDMRKVIEQELDEPHRRGLRALRRGADRRRLDRAGLPARAARRARRRGQGPVPGRRDRRARRPAEPRADPAADEARRPRDSTPRRSATRSAQRIEEELDYELEAQNQRSLARIFRGHPFIVDPRRRHLALARARHRQRVRRGPRLRGDQGAAPGRARPRRRDHLPLLLRLHVPPPPVLRRPAPGQLLLLDDGRMAFLDFGLFKRMPTRPAELELAVPARGHRGRRRRADAPVHRDRLPAGSPSASTPSASSRSSTTATGWYTLDEELALTPEIATRGRDRDARSALALLRPDAPRDAAGRPPLRPAAGDADAGGARPAARRGNWHRIAREWIYGDEPVTELGAQEAEFYAPRRRGVSRRARAAAPARSSRSVGGAVPARRRSAGRCRPTACATGSTRSARPGRCSSSSSPRADRRAASPGPLLAGASGLLFGTALGTPVSIVSATLGAALAFSLVALRRRTTRWRSCRAARAARCGVGRAPRVPGVLYARIAPGDALQPRQLRRRPDADPPARVRRRHRRSAPRRAPSPTRRSAARSATSRPGDASSRSSVLVGAWPSAGGVVRAGSDERRRRAAASRGPPRSWRRLRAGYSRWTWNRLVVPGRPLGRPAVMPTRSPGLAPAELDARGARRRRSAPR